MSDTITSHFDPKQSLLLIILASFCNIPPSHPLIKRCSTGCSACATLTHPRSAKLRTRGRRGRSARTQLAPKHIFKLYFREKHIKVGKKWAWQRPAAIFDMSEALSQARSPAAGCGGAPGTPPACSLSLPLHLVSRGTGLLAAWSHTLDPGLLLLGLLSGAA